MKNATYKKEVSRTQLVMEAPAGYGEHYQYPMLIYNDLDAYLPLGECFEGDDRRYYFDVTGACSLESLPPNTRFDSALLHGLISDLVKALEGAREYLLDGGRISLNPAYIFCKNEQYLFCYIPFAKADFEHSFGELAAYLVARCDQSDPEAVRFSAQVYKLALEGQVDIESLRALLKRKEEPVKETKEPAEEEPWEVDTLPFGEREEFPGWDDLFREPEKSFFGKKKKAAEDSDWGDWKGFQA